MSKKHKEEKVILFNYESHSSIIDGLSIFSLCEKLKGGGEEVGEVLLG